jgi:hypothetical protein
MSKELVLVGQQSEGFQLEEQRKEYPKLSLWM